MLGVLKRWLLPLLLLSYAVGLLLGRQTICWLPAVAGGMFALAALCIGRGVPRIAAVLAAALALGAVWGTAAWHPSLPEARDAVRVTGVIASEAAHRPNGQVRIELRELTLDGTGYAGGAYWTFYTDELPPGLTPGQRVSLTARLYHPSGAENPGGFDWRENLLQRGITIGLYGADDLQTHGISHSLTGWTAYLQCRLTARLTDTLGEEAGAYAAAMVLGNRSLLPEDDTAAFRRLGIAHLLSVSGFHVAILAAMLELLLRPFHMRKGLRFALLASLLLIYCQLTGMRPPALRAVLLLLTVRAGQLRHRQSEPLHMLCFAALVTLLLMPTQLTSPSFHLTYAAILGLIAAAPPRRRQNSFSIAGRMLEALRTSVAVHLGISLPMLYWYQELPLLGVLINIPVMFAASAILTLQWLMLPLMFVAWLGPLYGQGLSWLTGLMLTGIRAAGATRLMTLWTPQASILTLMGWALLLLALWRMTPLARKTRVFLVMTGMLVMCLSLIPLPYRGVEYTQLSVGNADAAVLRDHDTVTVIDTGEDGRALAIFLKQRRLSVDRLILTHLHLDHAGGVTWLMEQGIPIKECFLPADALSPELRDDMRQLPDLLTSAGIRLTYLSREDTLALSEGSLTVLWPEAHGVRVHQDANASCLVLLAELRGSSMLLTGDLDGLYELYAAVPADLLKVAHHGSSSSTSQAFLGAVNPQVLLLSGGDRARYEGLRQRTSPLPLYATQEHGAISVRFETGSFSVVPFH